MDEGRGVRQERKDQNQQQPFVVLFVLLKLQVKRVFDAMYGVRSEMQSLLFPLSSEYSLKSEVNISQENGQGSQNPFIDYKNVSMRLR